MGEASENIGEQRDGALIERGLQILVSAVLTKVDIFELISVYFVCSKLLKILYF